MMNKKFFLGFAIQISTVLFLIIQAVISPLIIGMYEYGEVVFLLTPVFLMAAVFEAVTQHATLKKVNGSFSYVINFLLFTAVIILFFDFFNEKAIGVNTLLTLFSALALYLSTWSQSCFYSTGKYEYISKAIFVSFISACAVIFIFVIIDEKSKYMYYAVFILSQLSAFLYLMYKDYDNEILSFSLGKYEKNYGSLFDSLSWRLNSIIYTVVFVYIVGIFYPPEIVGQTKYLFTILMGLRFACPFNTPMVHAYFKENKNGSFILIKLFAFYLFSLILLYFLGRELVYIFNLDSLSFIFDYGLYFLSFSIVLVSNAIGSYFVFNQKTSLINISSVISFLTCLSLILFGYSAEYAFSISILVYVLLVCSFVFSINRKGKV
ncbi:hypothetical protein [Photobacterium leiognathi]|uniref:hypothetical protein n=1 Tax=Photobacterium leiognathi TaxID=553611 RepID=UPI00298118FE|nr:hypothetical protein [Photobacterium leiognathi]